MTKETFNERVKEAEQLIDTFLDDHNSLMAKDKMLRVAQFVLDLHDHLEMTGQIKKLFKEGK